MTKQEELAEKILRTYLNIEYGMDVIQSIDIRPLDIVAAMIEFKDKAPCEKS